MIRLFLALSACACALQIGVGAQTKRGKSVPLRRGPVIDMHIHASPLSDFGGGELAVCSGDRRVILPAIDPKLPFKPQDLIPCDKPITGPKTDDELMTETLAALKRHSVKRAVAMGGLVS